MSKILRILIFSLLFFYTSNQIHPENIKKSPCHPWCEVDDGGNQIHYNHPYISLHKQKPEDN